MMDDTFFFSLQYTYYHTAFLNITLDRHLEPSLPRPYSSLACFLPTDRSILLIMSHSQPLVLVH